MSSTTIAPSENPSPQSPQQQQLKQDEVSIAIPTTLPTAVATAVTTSPDKETFLLRLQRIYTTYDIGNFTLLLCLVALFGGIQTVATHHMLIINPADPEINYPHLSETVPIWLLVLLVGVFPVLLIFCIFFYQNRASQRRTKREVYYVLYGWAMSMIVTLLITEFIKRVTGRPRPNFIALSGYAVDADGTVIYSGSSSNVSNAYQSFPSGHSSSAFSGLGYLTLYLFRFLHPSFFTSRQQALDYHRNQGWKTCVCISPVFLATWIAITRVTDYWHSYDDVVLGALIGLITAGIVFQTHTAWWWSSVIVEMAGGKYQQVQTSEKQIMEEQKQHHQQHRVAHTHTDADERDLEAQRFDTADLKDDRPTSKLDQHQRLHMDAKNYSQPQRLNSRDNITLEPRTQLHSTNFSQPPISSPAADAPLLAVDPDKPTDPVGVTFHVHEQE